MCSTFPACGRARRRLAEMDMDIEKLALLKAMGGSGGGGGGGGGPSVVVEPITITENGVTTAPTGTAYSPVTVDVQTSVTIKTATKKLTGGKVIYTFGTAVRGYALAPYWDNDTQPDYVLVLNKSGPKVILNAGTENEQIENATFNGSAFTFKTNLVSYDDFPGKIIAIKQIA